MKKLILACLGIGFSLIASAQFRPTFVYDDGNIPSGYFYGSAGFGGVYWSDGFGTAASGVVNYTPYTVTRQGSGTVISMNSKAPNVVFPAKKCNQGPTSDINISAGLFKPFLVTFGNMNNDSTKPYTVDISSFPVLEIKYSKPATPKSDYYISGQIIGTGGAAGAAYLYNLGNLPSTVTTPGSLTSGEYTNYMGELGKLPINTTVPGISGSNGNYVGSIYGLKSQGCCGPNINDSPLRVSIQVVDSAGTRLEMALDGYNSLSYTNAKLGYTMSTDSEDNRTITLDLKRSLVLDYTSTLPGTPNTCKAPTSCPSLKGGSTATGISTVAGFKFNKVAKILIFFSGRCAGSATDLGTFSTVGVCNYGPPNYTCYDNTVTITSFKLGAVPAPATPPILDSVKFSATVSTVVGVYYRQPTSSFDSVIVARSVTSTGGWTIVTKAGTGANDSNLPSTPNNSLSDYFGITTSTGVFVSLTGVSFTTTGVYYYKLGTSHQGLITWSNSIRGTNGSTATIGGTGIIDDYISAAAISLAPNPTSGITSVQYTLSKSATISYKVLNTIGGEVASYSSGYLSPGTYADPINLVGKTAGLYLVTVFIDGKPAKSEKLILE